MVGRPTDANRWVISIERKLRRYRCLLWVSTLIANGTRASARCLLHSHHGNVDALRPIEDLPCHK